MRALVTKWIKMGYTGRTSPAEGEILVGRAFDKLTLRIEQDGKRMSVILDPENANELRRAVRRECRKLP